MNPYESPLPSRPPPSDNPLLLVIVFAVVALALALPIVGAVMSLF